MDQDKSTIVINAINNRHVVFVTGKTYVDMACIVRYVLNQLAPNKPVYYDSWSSDSTTWIIDKYQGEPVFIMDTLDSKCRKLNTRLLYTLINGLIIKKPRMAKQAITYDAPECVIIMSSYPPSDWPIIHEKNLDMPYITTKFTKIYANDTSQESFCEFDTYTDYETWLSGKTVSPSSYRIVPFQNDAVQAYQTPKMSYNKHSECLFCYLNLGIYRHVKTEFFICSQCVEKRMKNEGYARTALKDIALTISYPPCYCISCGIRTKIALVAGICDLHGDSNSSGVDNKNDIL
jgi:hypothetical protein